jgi:hypothetical protein
MLKRAMIRAFVLAMVAMVVSVAQGQIPTGNLRSVWQATPRRCH